MVYFRSNLTVEDSPFKITTAEANEIISQAPEVGPANALDPVGKL